jgi:hypothetical protein
MAIELLTDGHCRQIAGVLSCYDRLIVQGTFPIFCYAEGMTAYLSNPAFTQCLRASGEACWQIQLWPFAGAPLPYGHGSVGRVRYRAVTVSTYIVGSLFCPAEHLP